MLLFINTSNIFIIFFIILPSSFGQQILYGTQVIQANVNDTIHVKIVLRNLPVVTATHQLTYSNNGHPKNPFSLTLHHTYNNSKLYIELVNKENKVFKRKLALTFELDGHYNKERTTHPCINYCEIIMDDWSIGEESTKKPMNSSNVHQKGKAILEYQRVINIRYNLHDVLNSSIVLKNVPEHMTSKLHFTGEKPKTINGVVNLYRTLTESDNIMELILGIYSETVLKNRKQIFKFQLVNETITDSQKHPCLRSCDVIMNVKMIMEQDERSISQGETESASIPSAVIYVIVVIVGAIIIFLLIYIIYFIRSKNSKNNSTEQEAYAYITKNQLVYTELDHDPPKFGPPKTYHTASYSRVIGILKEK